MDEFSSSTSSDLITVDSSFTSNHAAMEMDDDEDDSALRDLMDQRERLVAELASEDGSDLAGGGPGEKDSNYSNHDATGEEWTDEPMDANNARRREDNEDEYFSEEFDDDQVDKLLDESLANEARNDQRNLFAAPTDEKTDGVSHPPAVKTKLVLKRRGLEYFEVLPDGWIEVTHGSGIPVFLHKASRVCTFSRPYFIGPGSVRNHDVPISAIPCYYQRKMKDVEAESKVAAESAEADGTEASEANSVVDGSADNFPKMPKVKVQTVDDFKSRNINAGQLHAYCAPVFEFDTINVVRFKSWSDHRNYRRRQKSQLSSTPLAISKPSCPAANGSSIDGDGGGRPTLPSNVKLITVPDLEKGTKPQQRPFFLNPQGRTTIAVLHEYVQKVMKGSVSYEFSETRNAASPYCAVVRIATQNRQRPGSEDNGSGKSSEPVWTEYGKGEGNSKKTAKLNAAKQAMRVLIPGVDFNADGVSDLPQEDDAGKLFDLIKITDSRVPELSAKAGQPTPFVILQECLKRHSSFGDTTIEMNIKRLKHQQHEFAMKVAKHEVKAQCTNKKEGKQRAAQAMLEKLHPQISTWGSLIRLYGYGAQRKLQETRKEKDSIIRLQVQNKKQPKFADEPNMAILEKLKLEMGKLYGHDADAKPEPLQTNAVKNIDI